MVKKLLNYLFWFILLIIVSYFININFNSYAMAQKYLKKEQFIEADLAISKYNKTPHEPLENINGFLTQAKISIELDRIYLAKQLSFNAYETAKANNLEKEQYISELLLAKSYLNIGLLNKAFELLNNKKEWFLNNNEPIYYLDTLSLLSQYYYYSGDIKLFNKIDTELNKYISENNNYEYYLRDLYIYKMFISIQNNDIENAKNYISKCLEIHRKNYPNNLTYLTYIEILQTTPDIYSNKNLESLNRINILISRKNINLTIKMKINSMLLISQIYKNLEDYNSALNIDLKALELLNNFPAEEIHAIELVPIYYSLMNDYINLGETGKAKNFIMNINSLISNDFLNKNSYYVLKTYKIKL